MGLTNICTRFVSDTFFPSLNRREMLVEAFLNIAWSGVTRNAVSTALQCPAWVAPGAIFFMPRENLSPPVRHY